MRIVVLNGVNLDMLGRRDPAIYGDLTLAELESRIYVWAKELDCTVRCRQTNDEGEYVEWCHDALDWADGVILNPGAWTHYSYAIRDALELFTVPVVEVHLSNIDEREEWRRHSVLDGPAGRADRRQGAGRLPRGARSSSSRDGGMSERSTASRERLEEPLLVSNPVNVRYLTGLESSNAACSSNRSAATVHRLPLRRARAHGRGRRGRAGARAT